jgi:peptidoglycan hydrolase-like protein with peptidoglycan-binding domain
MWSRRPDRSGPRRSRRRWVALAAVAAAGLAVWQLWPGRSAPARAGAEVPVHTARIVRTDVATRQLVPGTLGYGSTFPVVDQLLGGTVTWVPAPGTVVRGGRTLYRVDDQPVTLLYGPVPAWRSFELGMTPGSDVRELERNLASLGFDRDHRMTVDDHFTWATAAAIDRWQRSRGMPQIGALSLGQVIFLPGPLRVATVAVSPGTPLIAGGVVLQATSTIPEASVPLPVGQTTARPGNRVMVTLPDGTTRIDGRVTTVGRVATVPDPTTSGGAAHSAATIPVTIRLADQRAVAGLDQAPVQVTITEVEHRNVLAVPVTALLARTGGGYVVQLATGAQPLIPVTVGLFDDATGLVEVTGSGLTVGAAVEVAVG